MSLLKKYKSENSDGVVKSVFVAYFILVMHVTLIAGIGLLILFFRGIVHYMFWIFLGGSASILTIGYLVYKKMKQEGKSLQEMLALPSFSGRSVEVNFLGGLASIKLGNTNPETLLNYHQVDTLKQISAPPSISVNDLAELARLYEKDLISKEEYLKAKQNIFEFHSSERE